MEDWDTDNDVVVNKDESFTRNRNDSNCSRSFQVTSVSDLMSTSSNNQPAAFKKPSSTSRTRNDWSDEDDVRTDNNNNTSMVSNDNRSTITSKDNRSSMAREDSRTTRTSHSEDRSSISQNIEDKPSFKNNDLVKSQLNTFTKMMRDKILNNNYDVEILRNNPDSPLHSAKSFEELHLPDEILKGIYEMNFQKPSKIQETVVPIILAQPYSNAIAQSQSGTGKTAAFLIASLYRIKPEEHRPQVLIMAPTLELALQISDVARQMSKFSTITVRNIVRGESMPRDSIQDHILVGTPGKLVDWIFRGKPVFDIKQIKMFILDEADVMFGLQGFREQTIKIQQSLPETTQTLLFSATYCEDLLDFAYTILRNPVVMTIKREEVIIKNVNQYYVHCSNEEEKYLALANIFGNVAIGQTIVFVATKQSALYLTEKLENDGHKIALLTGDLDKNERLAVIQRFREGDERVLIATNLVSRGIDIDQVTLVVNYDLPYDVINKQVDYETYLHRMGRAGRFGKPGFAVSLIDAAKKFELDNVKKIEQYFSHEIKLLDTNNEDSFKQWD